MANSKFKAIIIDDDLNCIKALEKSLAEYPEVLISGIETDPLQGVQLILSIKPELLFIDVEMPQMSGFEVLGELKPKLDWNMQIVFYTAYNKYLLNALRESAFDFLLKPFKNDELDVIMNRFFRKSLDTSFPDKLHEDLQSFICKNRSFMVPTVKGFRMIKNAEIVLFEYHNLRREWAIRINDQSEFFLGRGINAETILSHSGLFVQINKYQILNSDYIIMTEGLLCTMISPFDNLKLKISRTFLKNFLSHFDKL